MAITQIYATQIAKLGSDITQPSSVVNATAGWEASNAAPQRSRSPDPGNINPRAAPARLDPAGAELTFGR